MPSHKSVSRRRKKKGRLRRYALAQKRIAPSRKEGALTPRCPRTKAYRARHEKKGGLRRDAGLETLPMKRWSHAKLKFGVPKRPQGVLRALSSLRKRGERRIARLRGLPKATRWLPRDDPLSCAAS
jgi:hypothetical protein